MMLKFLLVCLGLTLIYTAITAYTGSEINRLEEQHNNDMAEIYQSIARQNDLIQGLIKQND